LDIKNYKNANAWYKLSVIDGAGTEIKSDAGTYENENFQGKVYTVSGDNLKLKLYVWAQGGTRSDRKCEDPGIGWWGGCCDDSGAKDRAKQRARDCGDSPACSSGASGASSDWWNCWCASSQACTGYGDNCKIIYNTRDGGNCCCHRCRDCYFDTSAEAKLWVDNIEIKEYAGPPTVITPFGREENRDVPPVSLTIKLNWNEKLGIDLDSGLYYSNGAPIVYWAKRKNQGAFLNIDTDQGDLGETIYLEYFYPGTYQFKVDNFTGGDLNPGVARVEVLNSSGGNIENATSTSPFWPKNLRQWHVFDLTVDSNGHITLTKVDKMK